MWELWEGKKRKFRESTEKARLNKEGAVFMRNCDRAVAPRPVQNSKFIKAEEK